MMKGWNQVLSVVGSLLLLVFLPFFGWAADEAELQVWTFRSGVDGWSGNGPLKHGQWPVRDQAMRLPVADKGTPSISQNELRLPADKANVIQLQVDAGSAQKCRLSFTTGVSPAINAEKTVEFDLQANAGCQDYTLDLKDLATWKDQVTSLRFEFVGARKDEELAVRRIKVFDGGKISTPLVYTTYRAGKKLAVREFRLGSLFSNDMILQRDQPVPVWGRAKPGETVTVEFAGQKKTATTTDAGKWAIVLDPMPANTTPQTMTVSPASGTPAAAKGVPAHAQPLKIENILVGDVWLCGGQSNMGGSPLENPPPANRRKELLETDYPNLRIVSMPTLHRDTPLPNDAAEDSLPWRSVKANSPPGSAVSYYFGQAVHGSQGIPVGLVYIIKAGSQVEQWMDRDTLKLIFSDEELKNSSGKRLASGLHNGMIAPILPFPIRGAIWYQGESNADNEFKYMGYYKSLPAMIRSWRNLWGRELPVLLVQLPAFDGYPTNSWSYIREAQQLTATGLPNVGLVVSFDEGDVKNLHPCNKYFIGTRLGLVARRMVYGEKVECSGPVFKAMERRNQALVLRFEHVGGGLKARGALAGFEIRGADQRWLPAKAEISARDGVSVSSPDVAQPEAVRYAWGNCPVATLFNDLDLPASPFRSDVPEALIKTVSSSGIR